MRFCDLVLIYGYTSCYEVDFSLKVALLSLFIHRLKRARLGIFLGIFVASASNADYVRDSRFSGFATLGLVSSDNAELTFRRDITQDEGSRDGAVEWRTDSLVGLQWYGSWSPTLDATVQVVARDRFDDSPEDAVEWAFVRYRPTSTVDVRVGRLGADVFSLSDYRQVGYALPWVRPPQDFYGFLPLFHIDGIDINKQFLVGSGTVDIKAFYGISDQSFPSGNEAQDGIPIKFKAAGFKLAHQLGDWHWRYTYANAELQKDLVKPLNDLLETASPLWPEATEIAASLNTEGESLVYHALGLIYDNNRWWARAEGATLAGDSDFTADTRYFYVSVGRRFGDLTLFGTHGQARPMSDSPNYQAPQGLPSPVSEQLAALAGGANAAARATRQDQHSLGVGARWDFRPKMALKLQIDRHDIASTGSGMWLRESPAPLSEDQTTNVISLSWDVLF